jgi:2-polyprenyl-3-methyl-5-hydroxy-6-metoxy-1,4-benzoquinol methylase
MAATLDQLRRECSGEMTAEYRAKQMHAVPDFPVVDRLAFIVGRCAGKRVLDIGASGLLHKAIVEVAAEYWGIDHPSNDKGEARRNVFYADLDEKPGCIPNRAIDVIVCGEVLEHLASPGAFLKSLRAMYACPLIVSVPNAMSEVARMHMLAGWENVNFDHTCWFSWKTLSGLLGKCGWKPVEWAWYNGKPRLAEGLIVIAE